jgi:hypothetical protein
MDSEANTTDAAVPSEIVHFDERAFLRQVRLKSSLRVLIIAALVVLIALFAMALAAHKWNEATLQESNRIDSYYNDLTAITHPNTWILGNSITRMHFPGASDDYASFRLVGSTPVPAGVRSVDFNIWEPERLRDVNYAVTTIGSRQFAGTALVPTLRMVHPDSRDDTYFDQSGTARDIETQSKRITEESLARLRGTPPSYTAEVAFSFDHLMTLSELESFATSATTLSWGAVDSVASREVPPYPQTESGDLIGLPLTAPADGTGMFAPSNRQEAEAELPKALRRIAQTSKLPWAASRYFEAAKYIEAHGVRYYGVVLTGPPGVMLKLAVDPHVTAVSHGLSVGPWE